MKSAPNLKHLPKEKFTEAIIFAGADAYAHAKEWEEWMGKQIAEDTTPPIYLGPKQLAELDNLQIIDKGRRSARVYLAGNIEPILINVIGEKLARAGVQDARLYKGIPDRNPEDWRDYLNRLREQSKDEASNIRQLPITKRKRVQEFVEVSPALNQMGASQRGEVLLAHYDGDLAIHADSDTVHHYNGVVWNPLPDKELQREMAQIYIDAEVAYSQNAIKSAVETMKLSLPVMGVTARNLVGFSNGVFDTRTGQFRPHSKTDWLLIASEVPFSPPAEGETLASHAPNFWKWLRRSVANNDRKTD
ncbi:DNA primase, partial [Citrobacter freundii]|nr:DNA primase [Citrobacter freundii]